MLEQLKFALTADDKASAVFAKVKRELGALSGAGDAIRSSFAGVGAAVTSALSVAALVGLTKRTIDGVDALNDLSDATGASVGKLSGLEDVAVRTGTSVETMGTALVKLNQALSNAKPGTDAARAFKAIGVNIEELKALDPVDAFQSIAKALAGYADDGNKARLVQELFGKSLREIAPLLKDAAAAGELNNSVTKAQAEAAERFKNNMAALNKNVTDAARKLTAELVPAANDVLEAFNKRGLKAALDEFGEKIGFGAAYYGARNLAILREEMAKLEKQLAGSGFLLGDREGKLAELDALRKKVADLERATGMAKARDKALEMAGKPEFGGIEGRNYPAPSLPDLGVPDPNAVKAAAAARLRLREEAARAELEVEKMAAQDTEEAWKVVNDSIARQEKDRVEASKLQWQQFYQWYDENEERQNQEVRDSVLGLKKDGKTIGEELGLVFTSAAGEAISQFKSLRDVLKGVLADILQLSFQRAAMPFLQQAVGAGLSALGLPMFASGGYVAPGTWGIVGEKGPELVYGGRAGGTVYPNGSGGGVVINQTLNVGAGVSRHEVAAAMMAARDSAVAAVADARRRGRTA